MADIAKTDNNIEENKGKPAGNAFLRWLKNPAGDTALFIIAVVLLNLVASRAFLRWDLTKTKSYSLSSRGTCPPPIRRSTST